MKSFRHFALRVVLLWKQLGAFLNTSFGTFGEAVRCILNTSCGPFGEAVRCKTRRVVLLGKQLEAF